MIETVTTVTKWDDIDAKQGVKTEATESITLAVNGEAVSLDLTAEHAAELAAILAPWLEAGTPVTVTPSAGRRTTASTSTNGDEAAEYRAALRAWADAQGRTAEYKVARKDGAGTTYIYPAQLKADFAAAQAAAAAKPETATEPETAPALTVVPETAAAAKPSRARAQK